MLQQHAVPNQEPDTPAKRGAVGAAVSVPVVGAVSRTDDAAVCFAVCVAVLRADDDEPPNGAAIDEALAESDGTPDASPVGKPEPKADREPDCGSAVLGTPALPRARVHVRPLLPAR
jgi:hypothetical protein